MGGIFQHEGIAVLVEEPSVELRKFEKRAGQLQSFIGPVQFFKLALQLHTPPGDAGREALTSAGIVCVWASRLAQLNQSPPMRQQLRNLTCPLRRQAREDVLQIGVRVMPVQSS